MKKAAILSFLLVFCVNSPGVGQAFSVSPRVAAGGSKDGTVFVGGFEGRLEAPLKTLGPYVSLGLMFTENFCADSDPPECEFPSSTAFGLEFGASLDGSVSHGLPLYASLGAGGKVWHGWDPFVAVEVGFRFRLSRTVELDLGLRGGRLWISERECTDFLSCPVLTSEESLDTGAVVVGFRFLGGH